MICVHYLQCQLNIMINKHGTFTEKIPKLLTAKPLLRRVGEYIGRVMTLVGGIIEGIREYGGP